MTNSSGLAYFYERHPSWPPKASATAPEVFHHGPHWLPLASIGFRGCLAAPLRVCFNFAEDDFLLRAGSNVVHSGVLIYKSISDFNVTIVQPGDDNFMGRTAFVKSNFVSVRFAHTKN